MTVTEVRFSRTEGETADRFFLCCEGHATGNQDVCAAVSAIVFSLAGYLENTDRRTRCVRILEDGNSEILFDTTDQKAVGAWEAAVFGLMQLEHSFGEYIRVEQIL